MVLITQIEATISATGLLGITYSYSLGILFSFLVTQVIPRFWRILKLAS
jgi:hypothetical protein